MSRKNSEVWAWTLARNSCTDCCGSSCSRTGIVTTVGPAMRSIPETGSWRPDTVVQNVTSAVSEYRATTTTHADLTTVAGVMEDMGLRAKPIDELKTLYPLVSDVSATSGVSVLGNEAR